MTDLDRLIEAVEAGSLATVSAADIYHALGGHLQRRFWQCHHGSLDAAKALHDALLPGWGYCDHLRRGMRYTSFLGKCIESETITAVSNDPARAWLLAILRAYRATQETQNDRA